MEEARRWLWEASHKLENETLVRIANGAREAADRDLDLVSSQELVAVWQTLEDLRDVCHKLTETAKLLVEPSS